MCVTEFLHSEKKMAPIDSVFGDQTVDVGAVRQWRMCFSSGDSDSGSPLLVQICMSAACRLMFIAGENAQPMVVTELENSIL